MATRDDRGAVRVDEQQGERKGYRTPELTVHGDVAEITGGAGPGNMDAMGGCFGSQ